jgi:hypothetical protein
MPVRFCGLAGYRIPTAGSRRRVEDDEDVVFAISSTESVVFTARFAARFSGEFFRLIRERNLENVMGPGKLPGLRRPYPGSGGVTWGWDETASEEGSVCLGARQGQEGER